MSNFLFFKQKTAYELRISDWSSDVCSSNLPIISLEECSNLCDESRLKRCPNAQATDHVVLFILNRSPRGTRFPITTCRQEGLRARVLAIGGCRRVQGCCRWCPHSCAAFTSETPLIGIAHEAETSLDMLVEKLSGRIRGAQRVEQAARHVEIEKIGRAHV